MTSFRILTYICPGCYETYLDRVMASTSSCCWPDNIIPPDAFSRAGEIFCRACQKSFNKETAEQFPRRGDPITPDILVRLNVDDGGTVWSSYKNECKIRFSTLDDNQLIEAFNQQVGLSNWTGRCYFLSVLHEEFYNRRYDYSEIGDHLQLSLERKIQLKEGRIIAFGELVAGISKERLGSNLDYHPVYSVYKGKTDLYGRYKI